MALRDSIILGLLVAFLIGVFIFNRNIKSLAKRNSDIQLQLREITEANGGDTGKLDKRVKESSR